MPARGPIRLAISYADWSSREYAAIARCVLTGRVHEGHAPELLARRLQSLYSASGVHLLNYAHHGIEIALGMFAHQRPECREVIVPAYICPSVPQAVRLAGLQVRYVDVKDDLNLSVDSVRMAMSPDTLAVIVPHMYGCPAPIVEIEALCRESNVFLIDDAAQVVGVRVNGRLLGTFGDVGVISFAQSKTVVTGIRGSGGVLLVNRAQWMTEAGRLCAALPGPVGRLGALADFLWNYVGHVYTGHSGYYVNRVLTMLGKRPPAPVVATRIGNLEASIALVQLDRLDGMLREKIRVALAYHEAIRQHPHIAFPQFAPQRVLARVMLLLPEGVDLAMIRAKALSSGVQTRMGYAAHVDAGANAPRAASLSQRLVGVPCGANLRQADVEHVCRVLSDSVAAARLRQP